MIKKLFMWLLNLFFKKREEMIPIKGDIRKILIIRTDERLGEIILTLPLINHLRRVYRDAEITFLMCRKYEKLFDYIDCDKLISFEKRDFSGLLAFIVKLRRTYYDLIVLGGKIYPPSLTSYLLLGLARGRFKAAIRQKDFNPFVNLPVSIGTDSEAVSKSELAAKITGAELPFDNSLGFDIESGKKYDVMIFTDARKYDHLIPVETLSDILKTMIVSGLRILVVSGRENSDRIEELKREISGNSIDFISSPPLEELMKLIKMSKSVIAANTGVMHLSVALKTPTCGIFVNAPHKVWGYDFPPHLMIDAREEEIDVKRIADFVKSAPDR